MTLITNGATLCYGLSAGALFFGYLPLTLFLFGLGIQFSIFAGIELIFSAMFVVKTERKEKSNDNV